MNGAARWVLGGDEATVAGLAIYRMVFALALLVFWHPKDLWIARFADAFFNPPIGPTAFFRGFPPGWFFRALNVLLVLAMVCVLFGYRTRSASLALAVLMLVADAWSYSFGKINHDILAIAVPLVMAFSGWGDAYSIDAATRPRGRDAPTSWPLALLAMLIGLGMVSAALPKIASGWLDPATQAARNHLIENAYVGERPTRLGAAVMPIGPAAAWELLDWATVALEAGFLPALASRRAFRTACAVACFFHAAVFFLYDIFFLSNLLAYAAFVDWSRLERSGTFRRCVGRLSPRGRVPGLAHLVVLAALISGVDQAIGNPFECDMAGPSAAPSSLLAGGTCAVSVFVASAYLLGILRRPRAPGPGASPSSPRVG